VGSGGARWAPGGAGRGCRHTWPCAYVISRTLHPQREDFIMIIKKIFLGCIRCTGEIHCDNSK
jgi:hypothetical protein